MSNDLKQAFINLIVSGGLRVPMARRPNRCRGDVALMILVLVGVVLVVLMR